MVHVHVARWDVCGGVGMIKGMMLTCAATVGVDERGEHVLCGALPEEREERLCVWGDDGYTLDQV